MNYKLLSALLLSGCSLVPSSYKIVLDEVSKAYEKPDNSLLEQYARNLNYSSILVTINNASSVMVLETSKNNINTYVSKDGVRLKFNNIKLIESSGLLNDLIITNFNYSKFLSQAQTKYFVSQSNPKLSFAEANISYFFNNELSILHEIVDLPEIYINYRNTFFSDATGNIHRSIQHVSPESKLEIQFFN